MMSRHKGTIDKVVKKFGESFSVYVPTLNGYDEVVGREIIGAFTGFIYDRNSGGLGGLNISIASDMSGLGDRERAMIASTDDIIYLEAGNIIVSASGHDYKVLRVENRYNMFLSVVLGY